MDQSTTNTPRHLPLPPEIMAMSDSETACKYCGVSYLIMSKMNALQREFHQLELELDRRKQYAVEHPKILAELELERAERATLAKQLESARTELELSNSDLVGARELSRSMSIQLSQAQQDIADGNASRNQLVLAVASIRQELGGVRTQWKNDIRSISNSLKTQKVDMKESLLHLQTFASNLVKGAAEKAAAHHRARLQSEIDTLRHDSDRQMMVLANTKNDLKLAHERAHGLARELSTVQETSNKMKLAMKVECESSALARDRISEMALEAAAIAAERDSFATQLAQLRTMAERQAELLAAAKGACSMLERKLAEQSSTLTSSQASRERVVDELRATTMGLERKIRGLEVDQADTIAAHQNRLLQVQESFQAKLLAGQAEREMQCRQESAVVVQALEVDLAAVRQALEVATKQMAGCEAELHSARKQAAECEVRGKAELERSHKQMAECEAELNRTRAQLADLKSQQAKEIAIRERDAATAIAKLQSEHQSRVAELDTKLRRAKDDAVAAAASTAWEEERRSLAEELASLRETVRGECEERLKLIALLEETRGNDRRDSGILSPVRASPSPVPSTQAPPPTGSLESFFQGKLASANKKKVRNVRKI
ncbi:hypothetical protein BC828DRAFT_372239 [Blastocladiella britannica]|nr:hypothetical protein BC828DRAFT_372239 [Blastocladiella britannica]